MGSTADRENRPFVLFTSHQITGHLTPTIKVAEALHKRGWETFFVGPTAHRSRIERAGAHFFPLQGKADFDDLVYYSLDNPHPPAPNYWELDWRQRALVDFRATWIDTVPGEWAAITAALEALYARDPDRQVIILTEALFFGILPLFHGATLPPGVKKPRSAALSVTPPLIRTAGLPPFGFPGGLDTSPEAAERYAIFYAIWEQRSAELKVELNEQLQIAGARTGIEGVFCTGQNYLCHDAIMQLGVPSFFFPRDDWPATFRFVGITPAAEEPADGWANLPSWWDAMTRAVQFEGKRLVVVAQGTVEVDPHNLIIPTLEAMRRRDDVLVVAILGRKGATLPPDFETPENARVTDYLHYDAVMPLAHAWVHNGGYGAVQHGIAHGVPMVTAGEGQDKTENCKRVSWSKAGVDLGTSTPTADTLRGAVETVLDEPEYKDRIAVMQNEANELRTFDLVEKVLLGLVE
jgi:UDP:flavonoid glycosyltransferase YjiC (YdhE family)